MLVVLLMVLALVITIAVLAQQWLATGVGDNGNQGLPRAGAGIVSVLTKEI
jgi:preprotein translocase subunit SecG